MTSVLLFSFLINLNFNTWALSKRALFSLGGKTFLNKEVNLLAESYQYLRCERYNLSLLDIYLENDLKVLSEINFKLKEDGSFSHSPLSIDDKNSVRAASALIGLIRYVKASDKPSLNQKKSCGYRQVYDQYLPYIVAARNYITNSIISADQASTDQRSSIKKFKESVLNNDPVRFYFAGQ